MLQLKLIIISKYQYKSKYTQIASNETKFISSINPSHCRSILQSSMGLHKLERVFFLLQLRVSDQ